MAREDIVVGLEIGTSKVCGVVGETRHDGTIKILGVGQAPSRGVRKGEIVDFDTAGKCVREALADAEEKSDVMIRSVFLAVTGLTPESLPAEGRRFVRAFATTLPGVEIEPTAVYGAAAADVVLDAIARSDGTRASVLAALPDTRVATPVGPAAFDADGDPLGAAVTVLRIEPGRRIGVFEDAVLERLVRAG